MQKIKTVIIVVSVFLVFSLPALAQPKKGEVRLDSDTELIADEDDEIDTLIDAMDDNVSVVEGHCTVEFDYFSWMPGYGYYSNFDVSMLHYKHGRSMRSDTIALGEYRHPAEFPVTSKYGKRRRRMHYGFDLGYPHGTPVVAAFDGIVRISKLTAGGYGELVVIRHNNHLETYYAHLSQRLVNPGQLVKAGDTIALGGSTGRSTGNHLHFETRYLGIAFSPDKIIDFEKYCLKIDTLYINSKLEPVVAKPVEELRATLAPSTTKTATHVSSKSGKPSSNTIYYSVKNGDTLSRIAQRYNTSVSKIKSINNLKSDFLSIGQKLRIK